MIGEKKQNDKYLMIDGVMSKSNTLLLHESDRSQKLLLKIEKFGLSDFVDSDDSQGRH
jgi:hypothetical protein